MKLTIEINLDNAAFKDDAGGECAQILYDLADTLVNENIRPGYETTMLDSNGLSAGKATVS
jgi:hypothetical protein